MTHLIEVDFLVAVTLIFLRIFMQANEAYDHELNRHMKVTILMLVALVVCDTMDAVLTHRDSELWVRTALLMGGYILRPYLLLSEIMIFRQYQFSRKERWQMLIPAIASMCVILSGIFHPYVFSFGEENALRRGFLSYLPMLVCCYYFFVGFRIAHRQRQRGFDDEARIITVATLLSIVGAIVEIAYQAQCVFAGTVALTLAFYYLYRHMDSSRRDTLTGAFNRASFFADLAKMHPEQITAFCEFDMNNLKEINDKQGHNEGDKAIVAMYSIIENCLPTQSHLYRFGGDEFAVLFYDVNMSTVYSTVFRIREEFAKSKYGCAIGIAEWKEGNTFREVYNLADENMYEDKKKQKEKAGKPLGRENPAEPEVWDGVCREE